jgi:hypothetical protein
MQVKELQVSLEKVEQIIFIIRGQKVMLSTHLAELYQVEPRALVQAVKRNIERFPEDFMFQLTDEEFVNLKSQIVISSWGGLRRATPYAFTEQGVAMLSSVLRSKRAVQVNPVVAFPTRTTTCLPWFVGNLPRVARHPRNALSVRSCD